MPIDPDVPQGACICRGTDNIMAMGHAHYCVGNARKNAFGSRLPADIEQMIVEVATDPAHQGFRRRRLDFNGDTQMRDTFLHALASPQMTVFADQCEDDPEEIVVRARGDAVDGSRWSDINIILLDPWFATTADASQALADDIVMHWERLQAAYAEMCRKRKLVAA